MQATYSKPALLLSSSQSICYRHLCPSCRSHITDARRENKRRYATVSEPPRNAEDDLSWPVFSDPRRVPTPYQIFKQQPGERYSKRRFYELVKLYHPDRNTSTDGSNPCGCSREEMLERYRLVVAAHTILSDRSKREAYDRGGVGWEDLKDGANGYKYTTMHRWRKNMTNAYPWSTEQDPMYNATWEDWEQWYERQGKGGRYPKSPFHPSFFTARGGRQTVYASNSVFISLVALLAALGGIGQATRANTVSHSRLERMQAKSEETGRYLTNARESARSSSDSGESKQERIERFMREREGYDEGEFDSRTLRPEQDGAVCASSTVKDKDLPPFWKRPPENP